MCIYIYICIYKLIIAITTIIISISLLLLLQEGAEAPRGGVRAPAAARRRGGPGGRLRLRVVRYINIF